jgi:hypothetical protein
MPVKANRSSRGNRAGKLFKTTKAIDIMAATVGQQVSLIKSIRASISPTSRAS